MPIDANELLTELMARLPELEWKISGLGSSFSKSSLPKGLFRNIKADAAACVAEIKKDIDSLSAQKSDRGALYLAEQIKQKINVLVALCHMHRRKNITEEKVYFGVKMLSTRQQWIHALEEDIHLLERQQEAMTNTLKQMLRNQNSTAILHLKAELGEIEQRLTLAKETLNRTVS